MADALDSIDPQHFATLLRGTSLYLVGLMGAGKSSTGRALAQALGYRFFDTDQLIEQVSRRSIPEIFASEGETGFRAIETQVLDQLTPYKNLVVATGGGIVTQQQNWSYLRHGLVIWLDPDLATIIARLTADPAEIAQRPLLQTADPLAELTALRDRRAPQYAQADVHLPIAADETPEQIVPRAIMAIRAVLRPEITGPVEN
jgi:shikimate kinase